MMKIHTALAVMAVALFCFTDAVDAQGGGRGGRGGRGGGGPGSRIGAAQLLGCLLYTSPSPRDRQKSRMPSSA